MSVLVIGDIMLDEYIYTTATRLSPEAPVPVLRRERTTYHLGGAANVWAGIMAMGQSSQLIGVIGNDDEGSRIVDLLYTPMSMLHAKIDDMRLDSGILRKTGRTTTHKTRIIAGGQQIARIDNEQRDEIDVSDLLPRSVRIDSSVIVVSDYAKGVVTDDLMMTLGRTQSCMIVDPKRTDWSIYEDAYLITPNQQEYDSATNIPKTNILITMGERGMRLIKMNGEQMLIPAVAGPEHVVDVAGAGDTVVATIAAMIAKSKTLHSTVDEALYGELTHVCRQAAIAAAVAVSMRGTHVVTYEELQLRRSHER